MRQIFEVKALEDFTILVVFDDGIEKIFDIKPYLKYPIFEPLSSFSSFKTLQNRGYFIEWENFEIDLSADTLWVEGKIAIAENLLC